MAATLLAELPPADRRLLEGADMLRPGGDLDGFGLPQREGIDRATRPRTARAAMAIAHAFRFPGNLEPNRTAKTLTGMCRHGCLPPLFSDFGKCYANVHGLPTASLSAAIGGLRCGRRLRRCGQRHRAGIEDRIHAAAIRPRRRGS